MTTTLQTCNWISRRLNRGRNFWHEIKRRSIKLLHPPPSLKSIKLAMTRRDALEAKWPFYWIDTLSAVKRAFPLLLQMFNLCSSPFLPFIPVDLFYSPSSRRASGFALFKFRWCMKSQRALVEHFFIAFSSSTEIAINKMFRQQLDKPSVSYVMTEWNNWIRSRSRIVQTICSSRTAESFEIRNLITRSASAVVVVVDKQNCWKMCS